MNDDGPGVDRVLAIELVGFPEKVQTALRIAFENRCGDRFAVTAGQGDVLVMDLEGLGDAAEAQRVATGANRPVVVLSDASTEDAATDFTTYRLHKPLSFAKLVTVLQTLSGSTRPRSAPLEETEPRPADTTEAAAAIQRARSVPRIATSDPGRISSLPKKELEDSLLWLLGKLLREIRGSSDERMVEIGFQSGRFIRIDPRSERVTTNLRNSALRVLAQTPCSVLAPTVRRVDDTCSGEPAGSGAPADLEELIWRILENGYRDGFIRRIDADTPCRLRAWPNLIRLTADPKYFALASYWTRRPASVRELVAMFDLEIQELVHVLNFASAVDLLAYDERDPVTRLDFAAPRTGMRSILRRLLSTVSRRAA